jgi:hypothetical protein
VCQPVFSVIRVLFELILLELHCSLARLAEMKLQIETERLASLRKRQMA